METTVCMFPCDKEKDPASQHKGSRVFRIELVLGQCKEVSGKAHAKCSSCDEAGYDEDVDKHCGFLCLVFLADVSSICKVSPKCNPKIKVLLKNS